MLILGAEEVNGVRQGYAGELLKPWQELVTEKRPVSRAVGVVRGGAEDSEGGPELCDTGRVVGTEVVGLQDITSRPHDFTHNTHLSELVQVITLFIEFQLK